jgi:hypothetical protein
MCFAAQSGLHRGPKTALIRVVSGRAGTPDGRVAGRAFQGVTRAGAQPKYVVGNKKCPTREDSNEQPDTAG